MDTYKKKRMPNYTPEEKENLFKIITKHQSVIDCKKTGAYFILKKKEAWKSITNQYNSICTTGLRDESMLRHVYNNLKHRARKDSASENKERYLRSHSEDISIVEVSYTPPQMDETETYIIEEDVDDDKIQVKADNEHLNILKKKRADDQKQLRKTGGGSFTPSLTDADHQVLSILDDQIRPDQNPYDDAANYFGDQFEVPLTNTEPKPNPHPQPISRPPKPRRKQKNIISTNHSAEALKKNYFKKKIQVANFQKKNEMQKLRMAQKQEEFQIRKQELEIKILKKQLENWEYIQTVK